MPSPRFISSALEHLACSHIHDLLQAKIWEERRVFGSKGAALMQIVSPTSGSGAAPSFAKSASLKVGSNPWFFKRRGKHRKHSFLIWCVECFQMFDFAIEESEAPGNGLKGCRLERDGKVKKRGCHSGMALFVRHTLCEQLVYICG